jgi:hypothetical protein
LFITILCVSVVISSAIIQEISSDKFAISFDRSKIASDRSEIISSDFVSG